MNRAMNRNLTAFNILTTVSPPPEVRFDEPASEQVQPPDYRQTQPGRLRGNALDPGSRRKPCILVVMRPLWIAVVATLASPQAAPDQPFAFHHLHLNDDRPPFPPQVLRAPLRSGTHVSHR